MNINLLAFPDCLFQQLLSFFFFLPRIATNLNRMFGQPQTVLRKYVCRRCLLSLNLSKSFGTLSSVPPRSGVFVLPDNSYCIYSLPSFFLPIFSFMKALLTTLIFFFIFPSYCSKWLANIRQMSSNVRKIRGKHVALETVFLLELEF